MKLFTKKRLLLTLLLAPVALTLFVVLCNSHITSSTEDLHYDELKKVPPRKVGLLLGTSKYLKEGRVNLYFKYRIAAAVRLYKSKKIQYIIASGDNRKHNYNEPKIMAEELMRQGVPSKAIYLDYAGFRTLDSVVRCDKIFGQKSFLIISQKFHNERALYIGRHYDLDVVAYNARSVPPPWSIKTMVREYFARVKAMLDLYIIHTSPRYLGKTISIP